MRRPYSFGEYPPKWTLALFVSVAATEVRSILTLIWHEEVIVAASHFVLRDYKSGMRGHGALWSLPIPVAYRGKCASKDLHPREKLTCRWLYNFQILGRSVCMQLPQLGSSLESQRSPERVQTCKTSCHSSAFQRGNDPHGAATAYCTSQEVYERETGCDSFDCRRMRVLCACIIKASTMQRVPQEEDVAARSARLPEERRSSVSKKTLR
jgi:hypothetical protein